MKTSAPKAYQMTTEGQGSFSLALRAMDEMSFDDEDVTSTVKRLISAPSYQKSFSATTDSFDVTWTSLDSDANPVETIQAHLSKTDASSICVTSSSRIATQSAPESLSFADTCYTPPGNPPYHLCGANFVYTCCAPDEACGFQSGGLPDCIRNTQATPSPTPTTGTGATSTPAPTPNPCTYPGPKFTGQVCTSDTTCYQCENGVPAGPAAPPKPKTIASNSEGQLVLTNPEFAPTQLNPIQAAAGTKNCINPTQDQVEQLFAALDNNALEEAVKVFAPDLPVSELLKVENQGTSIFGDRTCTRLALSLTPQGLAELNSLGGNAFSDLKGSACLDAEYGFPLSWSVQGSGFSASETVTQFIPQAPSTEPEPTTTSSPAPTTTPQPSVTPAPAAIEKLATPPQNGILITDEKGFRVIVVDPAKPVSEPEAVAYLYSGSVGPSALRIPTSAVGMPNGHILITDLEHYRVVQVDPSTNKNVYQYGEFPYWVTGEQGSRGNGSGYLDSPRAAVPMKNAHILVADTANARIIEIDPAKEPSDATAIVRKYEPPDNQGVFENTVDERFNPRDVVELSNGHWLVTDGDSYLEQYDNHRVIQVDPSTGAIVRQFTGLKHPSRAVEMPNGHWLITDSGSQRVIQVDPATGAIVNQYGTTGTKGAGANQLNDPQSATVRSNGHWLISDSGNKRVIDVDPSTKGIAYQYETSAMHAVEFKPAAAQKVLKPVANWNYYTRFSRTNEKPASCPTASGTQTLKLGDCVTFSSGYSVKFGIVVGDGVPWGTYANKMADQKVSPQYTFEVPVDFEVFKADGSHVERIQVQPACFEGGQDCGPNAGLTYKSGGQTVLSFALVSVRLGQDEVDSAITIRTNS